MGNFEERFNQLEQAVAKLSGCATGQNEAESSDYPTPEELRKTEQVFNAPTDKEGICLTEDTMSVQDYEFEVDVEGTTVYITRDIEVDNAYAVLRYTDVVHHMSEIELRRLLKWVEYSLSKK
jgi:hypothetical protein